jgi:fatty-acyl-CoA synthase
LPLNFRLAVPELQQVMKDAQPRLLVHDSHHASTALALQAEGLKHTHHDTLIASAAPRGLPLPDVHSDMPLLLVYTSGTTGVPKGAVHTQSALLANASASAWAHEFVEGDKVLSTLPMFHVGGLCIQTLPALLAGVQVVLHPRFDANAWLDEMATSRPSLSLLVPATMRALFEHPRWLETSLACLRGIMTGSSTVPVAYLETLHARGVPVGQVYGTTETGPVSIVLRLPEAMARVGASGWPHPQAQVKLVDALGHEVGPGETGEVCIRADNLMRGYWSAQGQSCLGLQDGWFHSGDLGQRAEDGCITIVGRSKDMIISGGENIYPAEIENQLVTLLGVAESAVVGLPDERWGEVPVAVLVRSADAAGQCLTAEAVMQHLQSRIARFKLPRRVVFVESLPKSALGKVQKPALQTLLTGTNP